MPHEFLQDNKGNRSSKRLSGISLIGIGAILSLILFTFSLINQPADADSAISIIKILLISGSSLLGVGVLEDAFKK